MRALSIRLLLEDGTPQGIRRAWIGTWSGVVLVCPRAELARLRQRSEMHRTGLYVLVGPSDTSVTGLAVYIGEADDVWDRLEKHDAEKDFWTRVVVFVTENNSLTKAHVRWLEAALVREARSSRRVEVTNVTGPVGGHLPDAEIADMDTFLANVRLLLPTLGVDLFGVDGSNASMAPIADEVPHLELQWEEARATCTVNDGLFVVVRGSTARVKEVESLPEYLRVQRRRLRASGVLAPTAGSELLLEFIQDCPFDSLSAAAGVVAGTGLNGRAYWKLKGTGLSYRDWQARQLAGETAT